MITNKKALAVVAVLVVVLLAVFGIDKIGGETWVSAAASAEAGWHAALNPPRPAATSVSSTFLRAALVPGVMVLFAVVVAGIGAVLNRLSKRERDEIQTPDAP